MKFKEEASNGIKNLLKLKDKESVVGVFRGEVYDFRQHWGSGARAVPCPGSDRCELCKSGDKAGFRFRVNFVLKENGEHVAKVLEQGWTVYGQLKALNSDYKLEKNAVKITRYGSGKNDTTYSIIPVPNGELSADAEIAISKVRLNDLNPATPKDEV